MAKKHESRRRSSSGFVGLPKRLYHHHAYRALSFSQRALLMDLRAQYHGKNNGALVCNFEHMRDKYGWKSKDTLTKARKALEKAQFILETRKGYPGVVGLYALTHEAIDDCTDKKGRALDVLPTETASNLWNPAVRAELAKKKAQGRKPDEAKGGNRTDTTRSVRNTDQ
jgi:hypothetical protein